MKLRADEQKNTKCMLHSFFLFFVMSLAVNFAFRIGCRRKNSRAYPDEGAYVQIDKFEDAVILFIHDEGKIRGVHCKHIISARSVLEGCAHMHAPNMPGNSFLSDKSVRAVVRGREHGSDCVCGPSFVTMYISSVTADLSDEGRTSRLLS